MKLFISKIGPGLNYPNPKGCSELTKFIKSVPEKYLPKIKHSNLTIFNYSLVYFYFFGSYLVAEVFKISK